jgi:muconolactone delta-isomerase
MTSQIPDSSPAERLDALRRRAREAADGLDRDGADPLAQMDGAVQQLCAELAELPRETAQAYLPELHALLAELDRLDQAMRARLEGLGAELKQHGTRRTAVRAYGRAAPAPGGERD